MFRIRFGSLLLSAFLLLFCFTGTVAAEQKGEFIVYVRGSTLKYDPEVGAELKEVILETWSVKARKKVATEKVEAYFHLSADQEIITPDLLTDECFEVFDIRRQGDKYIFNGLREAGTKFEKKKLSEDEILNNLKEKLRKVAVKIKEVDAASKNSAKVRRQIIGAEFTATMDDWSAGRIEKFVDMIEDLPELSSVYQYYVIRSFGWFLHKKKKYKKAILFYNRCIEARPEFTTGYYQKALSYRELQEYDKAIEAMVGAIWAAHKSKSRHAPRQRQRYTDKLLELLNGIQETKLRSPARIREYRLQVTDMKFALAEKEIDTFETRLKKLEEDLEADKK